MGLALKHLSEIRREEIARSLFTVKSEDKNKGELIGLCPIHGESNPSFSYNYKKDAYKCFSCNADGDLIRLWSELHGYGQKEGFEKFCEQYGIDIKTHHPHNNNEASNPPELSHEQVIDLMNQAWESFPPLPAAMVADLEKKRGWSKAWIEYLDLRLETKRISKKDGK